MALLTILAFVTGAFICVSWLCGSEQRWVNACINEYNDHPPEYSDLETILNLCEVCFMEDKGNHELFSE